MNATYCAIPYLSPINVLRYLKTQGIKDVLFLDSNPAISYNNYSTSRYSYLCINPTSVIQYSLKENQTYIDGVGCHEKPFDVLQQQLRLAPKLTPVDNLPPFQCGFAGFFGFELLHTLEDISYYSDTAEKTIGTPQACFEDMRIGFFDCILAFDHDLKEAWLITLDEVLKQNKAQTILDVLKNIPDATQLSKIGGAIEPPLAHLKCDITPDEHKNAVKKVIDYIFAGDIFQANMTRRLYGITDKDIESLDMYERLRSINPAPFSAFWAFETSFANEGQANTVAILSSSPERFISLDTNNRIETRPIKGTRKRFIEDTAYDQEVQNELANSLKDRAENLMIVDLMRNDLSRVSKPFSVKTPHVCAIETYETVHHLVSTIEGQLEGDYDAINVLKATFPGGSITGAPKVRAMEIISELERSKRGPYCGSMGYISLTGAMDTSIMIRTIVQQGRLFQFNVGGGIVADSIPHDEYEETITKARALSIALTGKEFAEI